MLQDELINCFISTMANIIFCFCHCCADPASVCRMDSWSLSHFDDEDNEDNMAELDLLALMYSYYYHHVSLRPQCQPHRQRLYFGNAWVQFILAHDEDCYDSLRMRMDQFLSLHQLLVDKYGLHSSNNISSEECLAIFLHIVSGPHSNRSAAITFGHSKSTINISNFFMHLEGYTTLGWTS